MVEKKLDMAKHYFQQLTFRPVLYSRVVKFLFFEAWPDFLLCLHWLRCTPDGAEGQGPPLVAVSLVYIGSG